MRCYIFYDPYLIKHNNLRQKCESLQPETETPGKLPRGPSGLDDAGKNKGRCCQATCNIPCPAYSTNILFTPFLLLSLFRQDYSIIRLKMISKTLIFVFALLLAIVAGQNDAP